jgi:ABC-type multidrug transport system ATPase subunit
MFQQLKNQKNQAGAGRSAHQVRSAQPSLYYLEGICLSYGGPQILNDIHLKVHKGEILFITGPSGAGKTSLLKILSGEIEATRGKINLPQNEGKFVAPVFQDLRLNPKKTCEENLWVSYDRSIYRSKNEFHHDLRELAKIMGIESRLCIKVKDANGGLKQKIGFIRAILSRPDILIADEPTASLDFDNSKKMFDILNLYNVKRGMTVIWASHNKDLVKKFSGRIVHLDQGKLIYSGHACFI